jgi:uncharacterized protein YggE
MDMTNGTSGTNGANGANGAAINFISVAMSATAEVEADRADLHLQVRGSSLIFGNAALSRAREVPQLVTDLKGLGVPEGDIHLMDVQAEVHKGLNSAATYSLRVHCSSLDRLGTLLGAITAQKNVTLNRLTWGYNPTEEQQTDSRLLDECLRRANARARQMAGGLGVQLRGIHRCRERRNDSEAPILYQAQADFSRSRSGASMELDMGMTPSHSKRITVAIEVDYLVSGFSG